MASLRKRGSSFSIVFARRIDGNLEQKVFSLKVKKRKDAEDLLHRYTHEYNLGKIDPFGGWSPAKAIEATRREKPQGRTFQEMGERFIRERRHVRERTLQDYASKLGLMAGHVGQSMPVSLVTPEDIRAFCFKEGFSTATQTSYLRFSKMLFKWMKDGGFVDQNP